MVGFGCWTIHFFVVFQRVLQLIQRVNELYTEFMRRMDEWFDGERPEVLFENFKLKFWRQNGT